MEGSPEAMPEKSADLEYPALTLRPFQDKTAVDHVMETELHHFVTCAPSIHNHRVSPASTLATAHNVSIHVDAPTSNALAPRLASQTAYFYRAPRLHPDLNATLTPAFHAPAPPAFPPYY